MMDTRQYLIHAKTAVFGRKVVKAKSTLAAHLDNAYVAISGGKDSMVIAHMAQEIKPGVPIYSWMDDLEWPETQALLEQCREALGWDIRIVRRGGLWDRIVEIGISPFDHNYFYDSRLLPPSRRDEVRRYNTVVLGIRAEESRGRMKNAMVRGEVYEHNGALAVCPLQWWKGRDVLAYLYSHNLPMHSLYSKTAFHTMDPSRLRVSWWIPSPNVGKHGYCAWLKYYYPDYFNKLVSVFPETGGC